MGKRRKGGIENVGKFFAEEDNNPNNSMTKAFRAANRKRSHVREAEKRLL